MPSIAPRNAGAPDPEGRRERADSRLHPSVASRRAFHHTVPLLACHRDDVYRSTRPKVIGEKMGRNKKPRSTCWDARGEQCGHLLSLGICRVHRGSQVSMSILKPASNTRPTTSRRGALVAHLQSRHDAGHAGKGDPVKNRWLGALHSITIIASARG